MKTKLLIIAVALLGLQVGSGQTADNYVTQGRAYLAATNLLSANTSFSNAVALSPSHPTANMLYGATRLLVWPSQPTGSNFLTRFGVPAAGRSVYHWTARLPTDTNGVPLAPTGVNAEEATAMLRTNLLGVILAAEANLGQISNSNFSLSLTAAETQITDVTLDYGDVLMLRAMLQAAAYFSYTVYSWNLDAQLSVVHSLYTNQQFNIEKLLLTYPSLLTFATTNDLGAARTAFTNAVARYLEASQFVRSRPATVTRLFNLDPAKASEEQNFRLTLIDLRNSLNGAVPLATDARYSVFLAPHFDGHHPVRSFLPWVHGAGFVIGTLPDLTFGGLITGVQSSSIEQRLAKFLLPVPFIPGLFESPPFDFMVNTLRGRGYVVQVSTNLTNWVDYSAFVSLGENSTFVDPQLQSAARRFYRVVDRPLAQMPRPANDNFANRIALSGLGIVATGYNASATTEPGEPGGLPGSVWYSWTAPANGYVVVRTSGTGSYAYAQVYTGSSLTGLTEVASEAYPGQYYNGFSFYASSGATYQIQVGGAPGAIELVISFPPDVIITRPFDGTVSLVPTNFNISALSVDLDGEITRMDCYADGQSLAGTTNETLDTLWTNVGPGVHSIQVTATDNLGITTYDTVAIIVRPPNDNFASRIPIAAGAAVVTGASDGASKEPGEPDHAGEPGGASVWWSWTAPSNGVMTISADLIASYGYPLIPVLGVYTGSVVSNLVAVASNTPAYGTRAQVSFTASAGVIYQIAVDDLNAQGGKITLRFTPALPPSVTITSPVDGATYTTTAFTNVTITATATNTYASVSRVDFYADGGYNSLGAATNSPYSMVWSNVSLGSYTLVAKATDNSSVTAFSAPVSITVRAPPPPNDNFANRIALTGTNVTVTGTNAGASREPGEPSHAGYDGGKSVWWSWSAPYSGQFHVTVSTSNVYYPILAVYTGTQISGLLSITSQFGSGYTAQLSFSAAGGQIYQIALDDYFGAGGNYSLSISP